MPKYYNNSASTGDHHRYLDEAEIQSFDRKTVKLDGDIGYFVVCDLLYPEAIHDKTSNLPLSSENLEITGDMFPKKPC